MIDLETMGQRFDAPVVAIGAVYFDPDTGKLGDEFYASINIEDSFKVGRADGSTVKWWMQQGDAARMAAIKGGESVFDALKRFDAYYRSGSPVWGNGATFDITILEYTYGRLGGSAPWKFWDVRDCRTIKDLGSHLGVDTKVQQGVAHNALDDAKSQARWVSEMWMALKGSRAVATDDEDDIFG
jgi:hypothetical protein